MLKDNKKDIFTRQKPHKSHKQSHKQSHKKATSKATSEATKKPQAKPLKMSGFQCRHCDAKPFVNAKGRTAHEINVCKGENSENQIKVRNIKAKELKVVSEAENVQAKELADAQAKEPKVVSEAGYVEIKQEFQNPVQFTDQSSIVLPAVRYAHETAKLSDQWIKISQVSKSASDLKDAITMHLITSNLDQHQVFMIVEYLNDLMTKHTIEYQTGLSKIDDEFSKWTFTDTQKELLGTYLSSIFSGASSFKHVT